MFAPPTALNPARLIILQHFSILLTNTFCVDWNLAISIKKSMLKALYY